MVIRKSTYLLGTCGASRQARHSLLQGAKGVLLPILFCALAIGFVGCRPGDTTPSPSASGGSMLPKGYLSTRGNQIVGDHGIPVRLACIGGWGSAVVGSHPDYGYKPFATIDQNLAAVRSFGFNCLRVDFSDSNVNDPSIMTDFDQLIDGCKKYGIKVILCHHNDEATSANWGNVAQQSNGLWYDSGPGTNGTDGGGDTGTVTERKFLDDWVTVARRYAGNSTVIGFDLDNEPVEGNGYGCNWGLGGPTDISAMYTNVGDAIQKVNPDALVICEGPIYQLDKNSDLWCTMDLTQVADKPIVLGIPNKLVYSVHEYAKEISAVHTDSGPNFISRMNKGWGYVESKNIAPVWIGEMGMPGSSNDADAIGFSRSIIAYINGQDGSEGGPTYTGSQQPIGTDAWRWGSQPDTGDGCMNSAGAIRPEIATFINALLYHPK